MELRNAEASDLAEILGIYNEVIRNSNSIYREETANLENRTTWFDEKITVGFPILVAVEIGSVIGYGAYGQFRPAYGYRFTVEHTIHVRSDKRGMGIGQSILSALIERAKEAGFHAMIGAIDSENIASVKLHASNGFSEVARLPQIAKKNGHWLTLLFMQKILD